MAQAVRAFFRDSDRAYSGLLKGAVVVMVGSFAAAVATLYLSTH